MVDSTEECELKAGCEKCPCLHCKLAKVSRLNLMLTDQLEDQANELQDLDDALCEADDSRTKMQQLVTEQNGLLLGLVKELKDYLDYYEDA